MESTFVRRGDVSLKRTGDEALLLDERNGQVHVLNGTAAEVWELCAGDSTVEGVATALASSYGLGQEAVRDDVENIVETFRELGLLEPGT